MSRAEIKAEILELRRKLEKGFDQSIVDQIKDLEEKLK